MSVDDSIVWRYMDLAKYVGLLSRGLFFPRAGEFSDPWEGAWTGKDVRQFEEENATLSPAAFEAAWRIRFERKRDLLNRIGVSCWHLSPRENPALWAMYVPLELGVALQSTVARVHASLKPSDRKIEAREVAYVDFDDEPLGGDAVSLLSRKRSEFAFENELRFFIEFRPDEMKAIESMNYGRDLTGAPRYLSPGGPKGVEIIPGPAYATQDRTLHRRAEPGGIHCHTDFEKLIEKVYLAPRTPYHVRRAVLEVTEAFGVSTKVVGEARMGRTPPDRPRFR